MKIRKREAVSKLILCFGYMVTKLCTSFWNKKNNVIFLFMLILNPWNVEISKIFKNIPELYNFVVCYWIIYFTISKNCMFVDHWLKYMCFILLINMLPLWDVQRNLKEGFTIIFVSVACSIVIYDLMKVKKL